MNPGARSAGAVAALGRYLAKFGYVRSPGLQREIEDAAFATATGERLSEASETLLLGPWRAAVETSRSLHIEARAVRLGGVLSPTIALTIALAPVVLAVNVALSIVLSIEVGAAFNGDAVSVPSWVQPIGVFVTLMPVLFGVATVAFTALLLLRAWLTRDHRWAGGPTWPSP